MRAAYCSCQLLGRDAELLLKVLLIVLFVYTHRSVAYMFPSCIRAHDDDQQSVREVDRSAIPTGVTKARASIKMRDDASALATAVALLLWL